jgi:hypothetical protein
MAAGLDSDKAPARARPLSPLLPTSSRPVDFDPQQERYEKHGVHDRPASQPGRPDSLMSQEETIQVDTPIEKLVKGLRTGNQIEVGQRIGFADRRKSIFCINIQKIIQSTKMRYRLPSSQCLAGLSGHSFAEPSNRGRMRKIHVSLRKSLTDSSTSTGRRIITVEIAQSP